MKTPASSCFKVLSCGCSSDEKNDAQLQLSPPSETKSIGEKRRWSFGKRSSRHRVLSNIVISDNLPSEKKEIPEVVGSNVPFSNSSLVDENATSEELADAKTQIPVPSKPKLLQKFESESNENAADQVDESVAVVIQTAIRGILARKELQKLKNVVKLQAAVRGHVVRQHAVGTLRCVQAIVKLQALVRARYARLSKEELLPEESAPATLAKGKESPSCVSIEKLLSNKFARQLMESTPKNKAINIKCDSSKTDSAWEWLERWMSVSYAAPSPVPDPSGELGNAESENVVEAHEAISSREVDEQSKPFPLESEENLISYETEQLESKATSLSYSESFISEEKGSPMAPNPIIQPEAPVDSPDEPIPESENGVPPVKISASEDLPTDGKGSTSGWRKANSKSFVAAQSVFEELSSAYVSNRPYGKDINESKTKAVGVTRTADINVEEQMVSHNVILQYGGSECGTELSVTSALDSPDAPDAASDMHESNSKVATEDRCSASGIVDATAEDSGQVESHDVVDTADSVPEKTKTERAATEIQRELSSEVGSGEGYRFSSVTSPSSNLTASESHGTPSSQTSAKAKKRGDRSGSTQRHKLPYGGKKSAANTASGAQDDAAELPRNPNGKRQTEESPRDSDGSSASFPHFMQATESAKAKLNANSSPRSSPDVQDRDYTKKRYSIPGANGRQESPRIQRAMSQSHQAAKVLHEKKWQR